jgi:hypothetical protein
MWSCTFKVGKKKLKISEFFFRVSNFNSSCNHKIILLVSKFDEQILKCCNFLFCASQNLGFFFSSKSYFYQENSVIWRLFKHVLFKGCSSVILNPTTLHLTNNLGSSLILFEQHLELQSIAFFSLVDPTMVMKTSCIWITSSFHFSFLHRHNSFVH